MLFERSPWSHDLSSDVTEWRSNLWANAFARQNVGGDTDSFGRELQRIFSDVRLAHFSFMPEFFPLFEYLNSKGFETVLITNGHHHVQREKLSACCAHELFCRPEQIIIGGEEELEGRLQKPAAEIFLKACMVAKCDPCEAIHVGDNLLTDVKVGNPNKINVP